MSLGSARSGDYWEGGGGCCEDGGRGESSGEVLGVGTIGYRKDGQRRVEGVR